MINSGEDVKRSQLGKLRNNENKWCEPDYQQQSTIMFVEYSLF